MTVDPTFTVKLPGAKAPYVRDPAPTTIVISECCPDVESSLDWVAPAKVPTSRPPIATPAATKTAEE